MSINNPPSAHNVDEFDSLVVRQYAATQKTKGKVREKRDCKGRTEKFPWMGSQEMQKYGAIGAEMKLSNVQRQRPEATLEDLYIASAVSDFNEEVKNFRDRDVLVMNFADATGREQDQAVINAADDAASTLTTTVAGTDGLNASDGLTVEKAAVAMALLSKNNVPDSDRCILANAMAQKSLILNDKVGRADYMGKANMMNGEVKRLLSFDMIFIGDRAEGGIPKTGDVYNNFALHKQSIGLAIGLNKGARADYDPGKGVDVICAKLQVGAVSVNRFGICNLPSTD